MGTIHITSNDFMIHYNTSKFAKQYDLLAINVSSTPCLSSLLKSSFRWDILSFCPSTVTQGAKWTRKLYYECVERHVYFEIPYSAMIRDSLDRTSYQPCSHLSLCGKEQEYCVHQWCKEP